MILMKKIETNFNFTRKCIASGKIVDVSHLVRINLSKRQKGITLDLKREKKGRGAYFIPTVENWNKILKFKILNKIFRMPVSNETYLKIQKELEVKKCLKTTE